MKTTIKAAFAIITLSCLALDRPTLAEESSAAVPLAKELSEKLQAAWEGIEIGREAEGKCTMTISGNTIHFQGSSKDEWYKATFTLSTQTDPKQLTAKIVECPQAAFVGKSSFAIFKVEDGKLTLVGHRPGAPDAPKSFEGDATSRTFVFKKAHPEKENSGAAN